jgi:hypothetical protein
MGRRRQAPHRRSRRTRCRRAPRAVLGEQLATGPGQPPGRAWEGDDRAALDTTPEISPLAWAPVSVTTNHLAASGERLPGRRPLASPLAAPTPHHPAHRVSRSLVRRTRRPRCPLCRRGCGWSGDYCRHAERRVDGEPLVGSGSQFGCWPADGHDQKQVVLTGAFQGAASSSPSSTSGPGADRCPDAVDTPQQPGGALRPVQRILHDQNLAPGVATDPARVGRQL